MEILFFKQKDIKEKKMNKIIALIGEAGSGKDFIAKKLIE
jgi:ABC-type oligopeptide transport system ATPase subunit